MNENQLKRTLEGIHIKGDMQERLLARCIQTMKTQKSIQYRRVIRPIIACAVVIVFSLTTVFAFNADFREYVVSYFKSGQVEKPPISNYSNNKTNSRNPIQYKGHQEIDNIADVHYYEINNEYLMYYYGYFKVAEEYYKLYKESVLPVTPFQINDSIRFHDYVFDLDFKYVIEDSNINIVDNKSTNTTGQVVYPMWTKGTEFVWLYIGVHDDFYSCIQYNLKTSEIRDVIKESGIPLVYGKIVNGIQTTLSPNGKTMLIHNFESQVFLLDTEDLSYISLDDISADGMELSLSFIDDQTLSLVKWKEEGDRDKWLYTFSNFDLESKKEMIVLSDIQDSHRGMRLGFYTMVQDGMIILVKEEQYVLVDPKTGRQYPIEGLKPNLGISFLINPNKKRIAVALDDIETDTGFTDSGYIQLGYIDVDSCEFKVFDRKEFSPSGMGWIDNSRLALPFDVDNTEDKLLCIYEFK